MGTFQLSGVLANLVLPINLVLSVNETLLMSNYVVTEKCPLSHLKTATGVTMPFHIHAYTTAHQSPITASSTCHRTF